MGGPLAGEALSEWRFQPPRSSPNPGENKLGRVTLSSGPVTTKSAFFKRTGKDINSLTPKWLRVVISL